MAQQSETKYVWSNRLAFTAVVLVIVVRLILLVSTPPVWILRYVGILVIVLTITSLFLPKNEDGGAAQILAILVSVITILYFAVAGF